METVYKVDCEVDWADCNVDCEVDCVDCKLDCGFDCKVDCVDNVGNPTSHDGMTFFLFAKFFFLKETYFFFAFTRKNSKFFLENGRKSKICLIFKNVV